MRQNPHVRICGGPGSETTLVYPTDCTTCGVAPIRRSSATQARVSSPVSPATAKPA